MIALKRKKGAKILCKRKKNDNFVEKFIKEYKQRD